MKTIHITNKNGERLIKLIKQEMERIDDHISESDDGTEPDDIENAIELFDEYETLARVIGDAS